MGLFDGVFNTKPQQEAAGQQTQGIQQGYNDLSSLFGQGRDALNTNFTAGLQPFLNNYGAASAGQTAYGNALGVNGPQGSADALQAFQNSNPGYNFQLEQGQNAVLANAAKTGQLNSGNTNLDLLKFGQGLANTSYNQYVQNLQPYLNASNSAASGVGSLYSNLGTNLNQNFTGQGNAAYGANTSIGNANANATLAQSGANANILGAAAGGAKALAAFL